MSQTTLSRRDFFSITAGSALLASGLAPEKAKASFTLAESEEFDPKSWDSVRAQFKYSSETIMASPFLISSHPKPVGNAIANYRDQIDREPVRMMGADGAALENATREKLAEYFKTGPGNIALTSSTTQGLALFWNCIKIRPDQNVVVTTHDHPVMYDAIAQRKLRTPFQSEEVSLYNLTDTPDLNKIELMVHSSIKPNTRVFAATWVHSSTGVKLPIQFISKIIRKINEGRSAENRVIFLVDGVHGFGVELEGFSDLGCDFFVAGTHKWLWGPRGTGIVVGTEAAWAEMMPFIPTFSGRKTPGQMFTPGGYFAFEHRWAVSDAVTMHLQMEKERVKSRTESLVTAFKKRVSANSRVTLHTPIDSTYCSGIVCFEIKDVLPKDFVAKMRAQNIIATSTPYKVSYCRVSFSIANTPAEIEQVADAVLKIADQKI